ncbi:unnamed protein product [Cyprideis torosa]|uniref:7-cyano-7-deazaguanine synthase n=1 Tax=Cyprideis torosa TaxID=163714 RepID=A0A7R8WUF2_9CRUS|nr:unnamed protein product [Cyprideis torosa]CAG0909536.1 unnamed protein product [Cyprideis torosa]
MAIPKPKTLVLCSGGIDSVTLAARAASERELVTIMAFDYGQINVRELDFAAGIAKKLKVPFKLVDLGAIAKMLRRPHDEGSPAREITADFPNRNTIMFSIAWGYASRIGADAVGIAVQGDEQDRHAQNRPAFIKAFEKMEERAFEGEVGIEMYAPFLYRSKAAVIKDAIELGVNLENTWSCQLGGKKHCGECSACQRRRRAFIEAEVDDPTDYAATPPLD